jgi:hypothetical protein
MKQREYAILPLDPDWKPEVVALKIEAEAESWWNKGWVFVEAKTDALMENIVLQFEREVAIEP